MSQVLGQLLQLQGELLGKVSHPQAIQASRAERLREGLQAVGMPVETSTAALLADALATGRFAIGATNVYLRNDGGSGVDVDCSCKPPILSPFLRCEFAATLGELRCRAPPDSACPSCSMTVGTGISGTGTIALTGDAETLGRGFLDHLPATVAEAVRTLSQLSFPVEDRLRLRDQLRARGIAPTRTLFDVPFPLMSEPDALERLLNRDTGSLLRLALGDYDRTTIRKLARGLAFGSIEVDPGRRELRVVARQTDVPGVTVGVYCECVTGGECNYELDPDGKTLKCHVSGDCEMCEMTVTIPGAALGRWMA